MGEAEKIDLAVLRSDIEALVDVADSEWTPTTPFHPEIRWYDPPEVPDAGVHVGVEALRLHAKELFDAWEWWRLRVADLTPIGDRIIVTCRLQARARGTGIEMDQPLFQVFTLRDGLVIEQRSFLNREQALRAAGIDS